MIEITLRYIHECSFIRGEHTNFDLWNVIRTRKRWKALGPGEAVALVSKMRNQLVFVYMPMHVLIAEHDTRVTVSTRVRLHSRSQLSPQTLALAAREAGLSLKGFKEFQSFWKQEH